MSISPVFRYTAYVGGVCVWSGATVPQYSKELEANSLEHILRCATQLENPTIILNGHDMDIEELRRWALIVEGCKL